MSKSCWDCLNFIVDSAYDEGGRCGEHVSYDGMGDEHCPGFEPLPKGACCARCRLCDWQHGRCVKHDRPVYTPDAMPCRNYDPNREEEPQEDGTLLLPGLDVEEPQPGIITKQLTLQGELVEMGTDDDGVSRLTVVLFKGCEAKILATEEEIKALPWLMYKPVVVQYTVDKQGFPHLVSLTRAMNTSNERVDEA